MKIVIPGGTGLLGQLLTRSFIQKKYQVVVLSRRGDNSSEGELVPWDACTLGEWAQKINGADAVINMTGKNIKCLYTDKNLKTLRNSRINSTRVIGQAIKQAKTPPPIWIQMSAAGIYTHSLSTPQDEEIGKIGEDPCRPDSWKKIVRLVQDWEEALFSSETPQTRKVAVRAGIIMSAQNNSAFSKLTQLCRFGLGGTIGKGKQMNSWLHESDFVNGIHFLLENSNLEGPVNFCSPHPVSQTEMMQTLRKITGAGFGIPATNWMVELSSYITQIDPELILKSRYVIPKVLQDHHFSFEFPRWEQAAKDLYTKWMKKKKKLQLLRKIKSSMKSS